MSIRKLSFAVAVLAILGTQALAQTCGEICTPEFWEEATPAEIAAAIENVYVNARDEGGNTPLHMAAVNGTVENVMSLIEAGANVNARDTLGNTPLHGAFTPETAIALIEAGAEVNVWNEVGSTPLHFAALWGRELVVLILVAFGSDVNHRNYLGSTPLHIAARVARPETIRILLDAGADGAARNEDGETPWDLAQSNEDLKGTDAYWRLNDARF